MKNIGKWHHRYEREPLEKRFAEKWDSDNKWHTILEYLLSDEPNERQEVSDHDREVAATVIQWLGSTCGFEFLLSAMGIDDFKQLPELRKHIRKKLSEDQG